jgi:terminase small subunit / prophage DNA-packing protein
MKQDFDFLDPPPRPQSSGSPVAVTLDGLAIVLGITPSSIGVKVRSGVIVKLGRNRFDLALSAKNYIAEIKAREKPEAAAKERLTTAQAEIAELKLAEARQELVPASQVEVEWGSIVRDATAAILGVTSKVQGRLGHLSNHDAAVIDSEIRSALTALGESTND